MQDPQYNHSLVDLAWVVAATSHFDLNVAS